MNKTWIGTGTSPGSGSVFIGKSASSGSNWNAMNSQSLQNKTTWKDPHSTEYVFDAVSDGVEYLEKTNIGFLCTDIIGDMVIFDVHIYEKKTEPLETILNLINNNIKLNVTIKRSSYDLLIKNLQFIEIKDLYSAQSTSTITVKFTKDNSIYYENTLLSLTEKRFVKIEAIKSKFKKVNLKK